MDSPLEFFGEHSIKFPIKDFILFESKYFWNDREVDFVSELSRFKLDANYSKPFPNMKDFFLKEKCLIQTDSESSNLKNPFYPKTKKIWKHFMNLEHLFRPHFIIEPIYLPRILEIFNFFYYFYDLIDGPDFDMEELYLCIVKGEYSDLAHDIHICLINLYMKEFIQKGRISFEKENGLFFPILNQLVIKEKHRYVLTRMFWLEFLKEIIIRRLLEEDSVEKEVDELLVEIQGIEIEEQEENSEKESEKENIKIGKDPEYDDRSQDRLIYRRGGSANTQRRNSFGDHRPL
jgi:hypothetical protein